MCFVRDEQVPAETFDAAEHLRAFQIVERHDIGTGKRPRIGSGRQLPHGRCEKRGIDE
jgi:hypothetical protein